MVLYSLWILFKILDMNASNILPEVFLNIIGLLEVDKSRNGWNLSMVSKWKTGFINYTLCQRT